jgi:hypothetical protein
MTRALLAATLCCAIAGIAIADSTPPKKAATPPAKKTATAKTPAKSPAKTTSRPASRTRYYGRRTYTPTQQTPSADRYREIQNALAAKGYLKTPPSGVWDHDSMDAMQRFQQDQKLDATGKLTAKSLGALGLGPKPAAEPASSGEASAVQ